MLISLEKEHGKKLKKLADQRFAHTIFRSFGTFGGRAPAATVLKRLLGLTRYRTILSSDPNGARMIRNVEKLLANHRSFLWMATASIASHDTVVTHKLH